MVDTVRAFHRQITIVCFSCRYERRECVTGRNVRGRSIRLVQVWHTSAPPYVYYYVIVYICMSGNLKWPS